MSAPFSKILVNVGCAICLLLTACATSSKQPKRTNIDRAASRPQRGQPVNFMGLIKYLENESTNLAQHGKIDMHLQVKGKPAICSLKLTQPGARVLTAVELNEAVEMGVAVIGRIAKKGNHFFLRDTCTGFFLTESGALVTSQHALGKPDAALGFVAMTRDGRVCPVRQVLAVSKEYDLVILQVEGEGFTPLPIAPQAPQGAPVWVLSHPMPWYYMLTSGTVSGYYTLPLQKSGLTVMSITADFANGSSGAPVLNDHGAVVGIASFTQTLFYPTGKVPQMATKGSIPSAQLLKMIKQE